MRVLTIVLLTAMSFFSGAIMYSYLIPKYINNADSREASYDRNPGGSNAMKVSGTFIGLICIILDVMKAFVPVYVSIAYFKVSDMELVPIAVAPVIGHAFSPFLNFNGGKAVASTFGTFLALYSASSIVIIFAIILLFFKFIIVVSPNSSKLIAGLVTLDIFMFLFTSALNVKLIALFISIIVIYKQRLHPDEGKTTVALFNRYHK